MQHNNSKLGTHGQVLKFLWQRQE